jgi:hypothetical protein
MAANEDFERVIGHISILFASWDFFVSMIITSLATARDDVRNLDNSTLARKLRYLSELDPDDVRKRDLLQRIQSSLPGAFELSRQRPGFLRDMWAFRPEKVSRGLIERIVFEVEVRPDGDRLGFQTHDCSLAQLRDLAGQIRQQHDRFLGFATELQANLQSALRSTGQPNRSGDPAGKRVAPFA